MRWRDVREAYVHDLALALELGKRADGFLEGDIRVGYVELVEVDPFELESAQAALARFSQVLRPAVRPPLSWARSSVAALRRYDEVRRIRPQRFGDQPVADLWAVRVGGVDEVDSLRQLRLRNLIRVCVFGTLMATQKGSRLGRRRA